jgi:hypothetical protein
LATSAVGTLGHRTGVYNIDISLIIEFGDIIPLLFKITLYGHRFGVIQLTAESFKGNCFHVFADEKILVC